MKVNDYIKFCSHHKDRHVKYEDQKYFVIHRISRENDVPNKHFKNINPIADEYMTGILVAEWFSDTRTVNSTKFKHWADRPGSHTGGCMPYQIVVRTNGNLDQCKKLNSVGHHAIGYNGTSIGCAFIGDFTKKIPTNEQVLIALKILPYFILMGYNIVGHDSLKGSLADKTKQCPGLLFPLKAIIQESQIRAIRLGLSKNDAKKALKDMGFIF